MSGKCWSVRSRRVVSVGAVMAAVLVVAAVAGLGGCGADTEATTTSAGAVSTTYAGSATTAAAAESTATGRATPSKAVPPAQDSSAGAADGQGVGTLTALQGTAGQKVISDAQLEIEVESGRFQAAFDQALLIADRYGGYLVSSGSEATGEEQSVKSGSVALRVPAASFSRALADADKLGQVKNRQLRTQDVTEEYVDIQARITNSKAHVQALLTLLAKAKTVDEILQVQQVLTGAQQQLEELQGRLRFLDEHTSYSTLSISLYEKGVVLTASTEWGFTGALKDALRNLVGAVNAIVRGLGSVLPVLAVLAVIGYVVYRIWLAAARRRRQREARGYQPYPEGWHGHSMSPAAAASAGPAAAAAGREESKAEEAVRGGTEHPARSASMPAAQEEQTGREPRG